MIYIKFVLPTGLLPIKPSREFKRSIVQGVGDALHLIDRVIQSKYLRGPKPAKLEVDDGLLSAGISQSIKFSGSNAPGEIAKGTIGVSGPARRYGGVHEQEGFRGTGFYIYAKKKTGMHFFWRQRGIWIRGAKRVVIPARPFLRPAVEESVGEIKALLQRIITSGLTEGGKP
jgi:hypothetical protein